MSRDTLPARAVPWLESQSVVTTVDTAADYLTLWDESGGRHVRILGDDLTTVQGGFSAEDCRDTVAAFLVAGAGVGLVHDDAADTLSIVASIATDLAITQKTSTTFDVSSSTGANATLPAATQSEAGLLPAADKTKIDGMAASANNYTHPNHSGEVTSNGDGATTIAFDAVSNAKLSDMAAQTIKARNASTTGDPQDVLISSLTEETAPAAGDWLPVSYTHLPLPTIYSV